MGFHRKTRQGISSRWLPLILAGFVGLMGYFGPWVSHGAAGLRVTGLDLGEYVKFIPQFMSGQIALRREIFYLPLVAGSLTASLLASRRALPRWSRLLLGLGAIPLALALLPPAWSPGTLLMPEFRLQSVLLLCCLVMVPAAILTRFLPDRLVLGLIALLTIPAAVLPAWGFLRVSPSVAALYLHPIRPGWHFWTALVGLLFLAFWATAQALTRSAPTRE